MVIYKITLTDGLDFLEYNIYYNNIETNIPNLYDITTSGTTGPATNIPYNIMIGGVHIEVPDGTSIINIESTAPFCDFVFSEVVRPECIITPTPTPTPTVTPTPTPTPTEEPPTNDCVTCVDEFFDELFQECGDFSFPLVQHKVCCTYLDSTGGTKNAPNEVTVTQRSVFVGCGGSGEFFFDVVIPSGSTTGCTIYTQEITEECSDLGCVTTEYYWQNFIIPPYLCLTPTPTPTVTPTPTGPTPTPTPTGTPTPTPTVTGPTPTPTETGTPTPTPTTQCAQLNWSFNEINGAQGTFELYVNSILVESRSSNSSGSYTVCLNDTISVEVFCDACTSSPSVYSNAYTLSDKFELTDAACTQNGTASMFTSNYTVVSGDLGTTFSVAAHAECASACV